MNVRRILFGALVPLALTGGLMFTGSAQAGERYRVELHYYNAPPARVYYPAPVYVYRAYPARAYHHRHYRHHYRHHHRFERRWRHHDRDDYRRFRDRDDDGRYRLRFDYNGD